MYFVCHLCILGPDWVVCSHLRHYVGTFLYSDANGYVLEGFDIGVGECMSDF